jgi:hypothetical protein
MTGTPQPPPGTPAAQLPSWLGPIVQITTQVGVPTVIAGVLLWFVLFRLDTTLRVIEQSEEDRVKIIAAVQDSVVAALDRQTRAFEKAIDENIQANRMIATQLAPVLRPPRDPRPPEREAP